jgi:hypothetical protein
LESEVLRLRANEANFLEKIQELERHIFHLQEAVVRNGIELPTIEGNSQSAPGSNADLPVLASSRPNNIAHDAPTLNSVQHIVPVNDISE